MEKAKLFTLTLVLAMSLTACSYGSTSTADTSVSKIKSTGKTETINISAKQFAFDPAEIRVKAGDKVVVNLTSTDVEHGFAIKEYGVNITASPGETKSVEFLADKPGTYTFYCSVPCGPGHREMTGRLIIE